MSRKHVVTGSEPAVFRSKFVPRVPALILLLLGATHAQAAPPEGPKPLELSDDPVLQQLIEQSLASLPELTSARAAARAETARVGPASALPDPMLQLGVQNDGFTAWNVGKMETSWYSIMASQTLPWPGKLSLRREVAELGASEAEQGTARARLSTAANVRRAYLGLLLAHERQELLDRLEAISQKSVTLARTRYETGAGAQSDVLRAQLELNRITQRRWALKVEADAALQTLNRLRGHPLDEPLATTARLRELALPAVEDVHAAAQSADERSPELSAARLAVQQGEKSVTLARRGYLPDLTVSAGVMPRGGDFPPMWLLSVGATLPVFAASKQSGAVDEAEARATASRSNVQALEQLLELRVHQRDTALRSTLETIRLYREGLLVQSEATAESTRAQYEVGKVTFASVLEANAGFISDQDGYLQVLVQAQLLAIGTAEVSLEAATSFGVSVGTLAVPGVGGSDLGGAPSGSGPGTQPSSRANSSSMSSM